MSQRVQSKIQATTRNPDIESQITWGDERIAIEDTTFRAYFQNIKGLHLQRTSSDLMFNLESMRK